MSRPPARRQASGLSIPKRVVFALVPAFLLLGVAELVVRGAGLARPSLQSMELPEQEAGLLQSDPDLFWSLRPGAAVNWKGQVARVNSRGLRGPELAPKADGEFRILSLGESTTFGVGVADDATYSARLQALLERAHPERRVSVLNAGVSAWSSFQSLKFLELRGLDLEPDMVLVYHEVNDYLPSTLRDSSNTEIGLLRTDQELYEAQTHRLHRAFMRASALYRFATYRVAYWQIRRFDAAGLENPLLTIGLPDVTLTPRLAEGGSGGQAVDEPNQNLFGRRVSDEERRRNLERFAEICAERGIALVVIHPAYRDSLPHECVLTRFCRERGVTMVEAFHSLHPPGRPAGERFLDSMHPDVEGHRQLAWDLYTTINPGL